MKAQLPRDLSSEGQEMYDSIMEHLRKHDLYQDIDRTLVFMAAVWWQNYLEALDGVKKNGAVVYYESGHQQVSPNISNLMRAQSELNRLYDKLGIGEGARQKLKVMESVDGYDPMNDL